MTGKKFFKGLTIIFISLFLWGGWPIYGFLSNQYEVARLPWGWQELPAIQAPDIVLLDPTYERASTLATQMLVKRREEISAPSLSAAITIKGKLVWAGAVGWRDITNQTPVTTNTAYRIGSTSKAVGVTGLARLVSQDILDIDVPISTYTDDPHSLTLPNKAWNSFTLRQLASHTAGLIAYEENNDWIGFYQSLALTTRFNHPVSALSVFDNADILYPSGQKFHYSGFDNVLMSAVMQIAVGKPFDEIMKTQIFAPLGLNSIQPDHLRTHETEFAISYQTKGKLFKPWRRVDLSHKLAAGGYVATPSDLALLGAAWLDDAFIPPDIRQEFWTPIALSNGKVNEQDYALGFRKKSWPLQKVGRVTHLNHGGVSKGAQCWLMIIPEHHMTVAISTNRRTAQFFDFADVYVELLEAFIPVTQNISN